LAWNQILLQLSWRWEASSSSERPVRIFPINNGGGEYCAEIWNAAKLTIVLEYRPSSSFWTVKNLARLGDRPNLYMRQH